MSDALSIAANQTRLVGTIPGGNSHPTLALLVLASGQPSRLVLALKAVTPACQDFAVQLVVIWPGPVAVLRSAPETAEIEVVTVPPESSMIDRRRMAVTQVPADVLMFVEEHEVERQAWPDVLASRVGLLRGGEPDAPRVDWRARLVELGVAPDV